jgi:hypothetical protein
MRNLLPRLHLVELEDLDTCPQVVRDGITDYLRFIEKRAGFYRMITPRLRQLIHDSRTPCIVDLCSGAGGPWPELAAILPDGMQVTLTDLNPNLPALKNAETEQPERIRWRAHPVDATAVPENLPGLRTLFTAFHHLPPPLARKVLADAARQRQPIAIFEMTQRHPLVFLSTLLAPLAVWLATPFMPTVTARKLVFTYLLPVIPFAILFDGLVSVMRTYTPAELRSMTASIDEPAYHWETGVTPFPGMPVGIVWLTGRPAP